MRRSTLRLLPLTMQLDRRWSWTLDGTLIPTRDHTVAGRSKNYRWSTNAHGRVYADGGYRGISELPTPRFDGNRIVRDHAWRQHHQRRARAEHAIAPLKD